MKVYIIIPDFGIIYADLSKKINLKILNETDFNTFFDLPSDYQKITNHFNWNLLIIYKHTARFAAFKAYHFEKVELSPMYFLHSLQICNAYSIYLAI